MRQGRNEHLPAEPGYPVGGGGCVGEVCGGGKGGGTSHGGGCATAAVRVIFNTSLLVAGIHAGVTIAELWRRYGTVNNYLM